MDLSDSSRSITTASVVVAADRQVSADVGEDRLVLDVSTGRYFRLPEVGGRIWDLLATAKPVSGILDTLVEEYDVDRSRGERDLIAFLGELRERGLIEVEAAEEA